MRYVLNSAVLTDFGSYVYAPITLAEVRVWLSAGPWQSRVGYGNTARWLTQRGGVYIPTSRASTVMRPGDEALVCRLTYRAQDPGVKQNAERDLYDDEIELGLLRRVA